MVSTFTPNKNIEQPAHNDFVNTWDVPVNADWSQIDKAFGSSITKNATGLSGNITLAVADYVPLTIIISGTPTAAITYVVPTGVGGQWVFANATTGGFNVGIKSNAGGTTINVPAGQNTLVSCDGSATGMRLSVTTTPVAAGSTTQVQFNNGGVLGASSNLTWDGTTLAASGLSTTGNTTLGDSVGDTVTINGTNIVAPNNLNFDGNTLFIDSINNRVGVGTNTPASSLTVAGTIESTSGGIKFPDASVQTSAGAVVPGAVLDYIGATAPSGWVLANGTTIGNAASAATQRANADTVNLFTLLWNSWANAQAPVSGGRGANAAADFAANKTITLPDASGRVVAGRETVTARLTGVIASTTLGAVGGDQWLQSHAHSISDPGHTHTASGAGQVGNNLFNGTDRAVGTADGTNAGPFQTVNVTVNGATTNISIAANGSGGSQNVQPVIIMNKIIKL